MFITASLVNNQCVLVIIHTRVFHVQWIFHVFVSLFYCDMDPSDLQLLILITVIIPSSPLVTRRNHFHGSPVGGSSASTPLWCRSVQSDVSGGGLHFHFFIVLEQPRTINSPKLGWFSPMFYSLPQKEAGFSASRLQMTPSLTLRTFVRG